MILQEVPVQPPEYLVLLRKAPETPPSCLGEPSRPPDSQIEGSGAGRLCGHGGLPGISEKGVMFNTCV
jgi:hypothetical protein